MARWPKGWVRLLVVEPGEPHSVWVPTTDIRRVEEIANPTSNQARAEVVLHDGEVLLVTDTGNGVMVAMAVALGETGEKEGV